MPTIQTICLFLKIQEKEDEKKHIQLNNTDYETEMLTITNRNKWVYLSHWIGSYTILIFVSHTFVDKSKSMSVNDLFAEMPLVFARTERHLFLFNLISIGKCR